MDAGLFSAATGMIVKGIVQDVIGRNLANVSTTGYKRERVVEGDFATQLSQAMTVNPSLRRKSGTYLNNIVTDFSTGPLKETGDIFDFAINGSGFFTVRGLDGQMYYTRDGSFRINQSGELVTKEGLNVVGEGGAPIVVPADVRGNTSFRGGFTVASDGSVSTHSGSPLTKTEIGRLQIVDFEEPNDLTRLGAGFYANPEGKAKQIAATGSVVQGVLEGANISAVDGMVGMIKNQRYFDAAQTVVKTIDKTFSALFSVVG